MRRSAKIFVANETSSDGGLRCRSRSCSRASSEEEFYSPAISRGHYAPPKVSGSPSSLNRSTSGYGWKSQGSSYRQDLDSGFLDDSNQSGEFKPSSLLTKLAEQSSHMVSPDVKNNIRDLKKRWKKYNSALYTSGPVRSGSMKVNDLLPIVVMIITLGSAIFTVCMLTNALNKAQRNRNGKYDSIQYAHDGTVLEDGSLSMSIVDENGVPLGGKKASIQFAYNMRQKREQAEKAEQDKLEGIEILGMTDEEIINRLTLKVANDVMKIYDGVQTNDKEKSANKKERLLKKIGEFGHFGTSAVQPLDLDQVIEEKIASKNSLEKIQKEPAVASKNDLESIAAEAKPEAASKNQILEKPEKTDKVETKADEKPAKRVKRDATATGEMSMKQNPFRIDDLTSAIVKSEDDPFRFLG